MWVPLKVQRNRSIHRDYASVESHAQRWLINNVSVSYQDGASNKSKKRKLSRDTLSELQAPTTLVSGIIMSCFVRATYPSFFVLWRRRISGDNRPFRWVFHIKAWIWCRTFLWPSASTYLYFITYQNVLWIGRENAENRQLPAWCNGKFILLLPPHYSPVISSGGYYCRWT